MDTKRDNLKEFKCPGCTLLDTKRGVECINCIHNKYKKDEYIKYKRRNK